MVGTLSLTMLSPCWWSTCLIYCVQMEYICAELRRLVYSPKVVWRFQFHSTGQLDKFISRIILWFLRWQLSWKARSLRCVNIIENSSREHSYLPFFPKYERQVLKRKHLWKPQLKIKMVHIFLKSYHFQLESHRIIINNNNKTSDFATAIFVVTAKCK